MLFLFKLSFYFFYWIFSTLIQLNLAVFHLQIVFSASCPEMFSYPKTKNTLMHASQSFKDFRIYCALMYLDLKLMFV